MSIDAGTSELDKVMENIYHSNKYRDDRSDTGRNYPELIRVVLNCAPNAPIDDIINMLIIGNSDIADFRMKSVRSGYAGYCGECIAALQKNDITETHRLTEYYPKALYSVLAVGGYYSPDYPNPDPEKEIDTPFMIESFIRFLDAATEEYLCDELQLPGNIFKNLSIYSSMVKKIVWDTREEAQYPKYEFDSADRELSVRASYDVYIDKLCDSVRTMLESPPYSDDAEYIGAQIETLSLGLRRFYEICVKNFVSELLGSGFVVRMWKDDCYAEQCAKQDTFFSKYMPNGVLDTLRGEIFDITNQCIISKICNGSDLAECKEDYLSKLRTLYFASVQKYMNFDIYRVFIRESLHVSLIDTEIGDSNQQTPSVILSIINNILSKLRIEDASEEEANASKTYRELDEIDSIINECDSYRDTALEASGSSKAVRYQEKAGSKIGSNISKAYELAKDGKAKIQQQTGKAMSSMKNFILGKEDTDKMVIEGKSFTFLGLAKRLFMSVAVFNVSAVSGICLLIIQWAQSSKAKKNSKRKMLMMLEEEIKMTDEKIQDASSDGNRQAKYALMRSKAEYENAYKRIKYNMGAEIKLEETPALRELASRSSSGGRIRPNDSLRNAEVLQHGPKGGRHK